MARLVVRVTTRAGRDAIGHFDDEGRLHLRVAAAPVDGAANAAVVQMLAKALGIPSRDVVLVSGTTARVKTFDVPLADNDIVSRLQNAHSASS